MIIPTLTFEVVDNPSHEDWEDNGDYGAPEPHYQLVQVKFGDQVLVEVPGTMRYHQTNEEFVAEVIGPIIQRLFLEGGPSV